MKENHTLEALVRYWGVGGDNRRPHFVHWRLDSLYIRAPPGVDSRQKYRCTKHFGEFHRGQKLC